MDLPKELILKITDNLTVNEREEHINDPLVVYDKTLIDEVENNVNYEWVEIKNEYRDINPLTVRKLTLNFPLSFDPDKLLKYIYVNELNIKYHSYYDLNDLPIIFTKRIQYLKIIIEDEETNYLDNISLEIYEMFPNIIFLEYKNQYDNFNGFHQPMTINEKLRILNILYFDEITLEFVENLEKMREINLVASNINIRNCNKKILPNLNILKITTEKLEGKENSFRGIKNLEVEMKMMYTDEIEFIDE